MFLIRVGEPKTGSYTFCRARRVGKNISQSNGTVKGTELDDDGAVKAALEQFAELKGCTATKYEDMTSAETTIVAVFR